MTFAQHLGLRLIHPWFLTVLFVESINVWVMGWGVGELSHGRGRSAWLIRSCLTELLNAYNWKPVAFYSVAFFQYLGRKIVHLGVHHPLLKSINVLVDGWGTGQSSHGRGCTLCAKKRYTCAVELFM